MPSPSRLRSPALWLAALFALAGCDGSEPRPEPPPIPPITCFPQNLPGTDRFFTARLNGEVWEANNGARAALNPNPNGSLILTAERRSACREAEAFYFFVPMMPDSLGEAEIGEASFVDLNEDSIEILYEAGEDEPVEGRLIITRRDDVARVLEGTFEVVLAGREDPLPGRPLPSDTLRVTEGRFRVSSEPSPP